MAVTLAFKYRNGALLMKPSVITLMLRCKPQIQHETAVSQTQVRLLVVPALDI
jgi:hypothetical protein